MLYHLSESDVTLQLGNDDYQPPISKIGKGSIFFTWPANSITKLSSNSSKKSHTLVLVQRAEHLVGSILKISSNS